MSEPKKNNENLDKVYAEASQWVRMANTIVWTAGNFLIPASIAPFALLFTRTSFQLETKHLLFSAFISITIASVWCSITIVYLKTTKVARQTMLDIEAIWSKEFDSSPNYTSNQSHTLGIWLKNNNKEEFEPNLNYFYKSKKLGVWLKKEENSSETLIQGIATSIITYLKNPIIRLQAIYVVVLLLFWITVLIYWLPYCPQKSDELLNNCNYLCNLANNSNQ